MTLFYYDPVFMEHQTGQHPERAARLLSVIRHLNFIGLDSCCTRPSWAPVSSRRLGYVHSVGYVESIEKFAEAGGGYLDEDTIVSRKSCDVAKMAAGAACDAVERVIQGDDQTAFCLVRPPGHHAMPDHAMGFCLFNNVAVAARVATEELGIERLLIVDFDVHHGNGTQAMFWEDADVGYFSMHRSPFYPGTGAADEIGMGAGRGTTLNIPIPFGTSTEVQLATFNEQIHAFADRMKPQLLIVSAGFDGHKNDPIGSLGLERDDFRVLTRVLMDVASRHCDGKLVSVLEGGYDADALSECVEVHLEELLGTSDRR